MTALLQLVDADIVNQWWAWLTLIAVILGEVLAVFFVFRVIQSGGRPGATIAWIIVILAAPYLGLAAYYLLGRRMTIKRLRFQKSARSGLSESLTDVVLEVPPKPRDDPLLRLLGNLDPESVQDGNSLRLLGSGPEFWDTASAAVASATSFVHLEVYILRPDDTGKELLRALAEKARQGVEVRVLYDSVGSWSLHDEHLEELHAAGGKSAAFLPLLWRHRPFTLNMRNHRKLLVVDGKTAFVGGRNVGDEYVEDRFGHSHKWLDCMMQVSGPSVRRLHRTFVQDWHTAAEEVLTDARYFPAVAKAGDQTVAVVEGGPDVEDNTLHWMFLHMVMLADQTIRISSPYLVPNPSLLEAMRATAARGVKIRIQTNGAAAESRLLFWAKRSFYRDLAVPSISITETIDDYNHSKMIIVDDRYCFVGSPNLDVRSEELNFELGIIALGPEICSQATELFEERIRNGRVIEPGMIRNDWRSRFLHGVGRLASPLL